MFYFHDNDLWRNEKKNFDSIVWNISNEWVNTISVDYSFKTKFRYVQCDQSFQSLDGCFIDNLPSSIKLPKQVQKLPNAKLKSYQNFSKDC